MIQFLILEESYQTVSVSTANTLNEKMKILHGSMCSSIKSKHKKPNLILEVSYQTVSISTADTWKDKNTAQIYFRFKKKKKKKKTQGTWHYFWSTVIYQIDTTSDTVATWKDKTYCMDLFALP